MSKSDIEKSPSLATGGLPLLGGLDPCLGDLGFQVFSLAANHESHGDLLSLIYLYYT